MTNVFWLFGNDQTLQAVVYNNPSFARIRDIQNRGFKLIWDSAPSREAAFDYAERHGDSSHNFYSPECCQGCQYYRDVDLYVGRRWSDYRERWIVFRGKLCDMCAQDDIYKVRPVKCGPQLPQFPSQA